MDRANTPQPSIPAHAEKPSRLRPFAYQGLAGKVFWLCATRRRTGCQSLDEARVLLRPEGSRPLFDVQIFADAETPAEILNRRARQAREAIGGDSKTWRLIEPWLARRLEYVWVNAREPIVTVDDLILAILDAFPIPQDPQL